MLTPSTLVIERVKALCYSRSTSRSVSRQGGASPAEDTAHTTFPIQDLENIEHAFVFLPTALALYLQEHLGTFYGGSDKGCRNGRKETRSSKLRYA